MILEVFYGHTVKNKTYSPAIFSSYTFGKADALKKLAEEGHFSEFFIELVYLQVLNKL
ncbi:hypothetical protein CFB3_30070 [Clostridium folliculivorans]|uniref:Uncharacterized protein n=1 Tax=Clostridium folliculivorans TaxID=2886038 RepID=A0A9W5Y1K1_9CLOT|nr:hypothetical protein CFOLD11_16280 [Clostridium folliculivorans]GKU30900.1 hypothetical protein CFB3_30070 [Clostridium folliculivorans]